MRNTFTDDAGFECQRDYKASGLSVDEFIRSRTDAFDIQFLKDVDLPKSGVTLRYASFHTATGEGVLSYYYWSDRDEWFAKF